MKKISLVLILISNLLFSQEESNPFTSNDNEIENIGERVLLYNIEMDGLTIPLEIVYNHNGFKALDIPSIVGLGWQFLDLGKIKRTVNHLPDDLPPSSTSSLPNNGGWLFNDNSKLNIVGNFSNNSNGELIRNSYDVRPDFYSFSTSTGKNALFTFDKTIINNNVNLIPVFLDSNENYTLNTNFNNFQYGINDYQNIVFDINDENGFTYSFIGGPTNQIYFRNGSSYNTNTKDYYTKKIKSNHNTDEINITYLAKNHTAYIVNEEGFKTTSGTVAVITSSDYYQKDENELVISEITTPKEKIYFEYSNYSIGNNQSYSPINVPILNTIYIKNNNNEIITSYIFEYNESIGGKPLLTGIYKGKKEYSSDYDYINNSIKIKGYEYFNYSQLDLDLQYTDPTFSFKNMDSFGYYNGAQNNTLFPVNFKICGSLPKIYNAADRKPNLLFTKQGVLKKVINNLGGIKEYDYQLNADSNADYNIALYGGGLKISKITDKPDINTSIETNFEYQNYSGFGIRLNIPEVDMMGSFFNGVQPVKSYINNELHDFCQEADYVSHYQKSGNYFEKIISTRFIKNLIDQGTSDVGVLYLKKVNTYRPNYKTLLRTPLIQKKEVFNDYIYETSGGSVPTSKTDYIYGFDLQNVNYTYSINSNKIYTGAVATCQGDYYYNNISITNSPILKLEMPLKSILTEDYLKAETDNGFEIQTKKSKKEITYFGENHPNYQLNVLRPREIITYTNDIPVLKLKYKYLLEEFIPNAGLQDLNTFNNESKTLVSNKSTWTYDGSQWILSMADFYQYYNDGKIKTTASTAKTVNNTFFTESNFNPYYFNGSLTGVPVHNEIEYQYNDDGKISLIKNNETKKFKKFYRDNDFDTNLINSILEGNSLQNEFEMYRNSFENSIGVDYLETNNAYSGDKVFVGETFIVDNEYPQGYIVSFWSYRESKWIFNEYIHEGGVVKINMPTNANYIDEVWVRPSYSSLEGKIYNKYFETSSFINDKGFIIKNIYDDYGRLIKQVDQDGNINNERIYNFTQE